MRLKNNAQRVSVKLSSFSNVSDANRAFQLGVFKNANLPTLTYSDASDYTEFGLLGGQVTGGVLIAADVGIGQRTQTSFDLTTVKDMINLRYDGTSETFALCVRRIDSAPEVSAILNFFEIR